MRSALRDAPELPLRALRAEHRQPVLDVEVFPPFVSRVLVVARLAAALGADKITGIGHLARLREGC
jgi:hypothetical protein